MATDWPRYFGHVSASAKLATTLMLSLALSPDAHLPAAYNPDLKQVIQKLIDRLCSASGE